jgi:hypothetical protein
MEDAAKGQGSPEHRPVQHWEGLRFDHRPHENGGRTCRGCYEVESQQALFVEYLFVDP